MARGNKSWIHSGNTEERKRRNQMMIQHMEQGIHHMEQWTEQECRRLKMTTRARQAAEKAWKMAAVYARKYFISPFPKHTPVERRFLKMMLKLILAEEPSLVDKAFEVARYLSNNYVYEWLISPCTRAARAEARALLLSSAESEFGETPMAGPVAFVQYHWRQLGVRNVSDLGEVYRTTVFLDQHQFFFSKHEEWRRALGLHKLAAKRQMRAEQEAARQKQAQQAGQQPQSAQTGGGR